MVEHFLDISHKWYSASCASSWLVRSGSNFPGRYIPWCGIYHLLPILVLQSQVIHFVKHLLNTIFCNAIPLFSFHLSQLLLPLSYYNRISVLLDCPLLDPQLNPKYCFESIGSTFSLFIIFSVSNTSKQFSPIFFLEFYPNMSIFAATLV